jgi:hypothetical protein
MPATVRAPERFTIYFHIVQLVVRCGTWLGGPDNDWGRHT